MKTARAIWPALMFAMFAAVAQSAVAVEAAWTEIPPAQWSGHVKAEVPALKHEAAAAVAFPTKEAKPLTVTTAQPQPPGVYEVRLTLRPSHVAGAIAFNSGVRLKIGNATAADFPGQFFARAHQPETRTAQFTQTAVAPLALRLEAFTDAALVETANIATVAKKKGGPKLDDAKNGDDADLDLGLTLTPERAVYYIVDKVEFRPLSRSGRVAKVSVDKVRYNPGDTLKGSVVVEDAGGKGGDGAVNLYFEHNVKDRTQVKTLPVKLNSTPQTLTFELPLPKEELGYALVAEYVSTDGADRVESAEYFNIAANFNRVAMYGGVGSMRDATLDEATIRQTITEARADYINAGEFFAWAEEDMVKMSPETDYWFSGQTCYHMNKKTLQDQIRLAHEQGVAMVTYGKFVMSEYIGWKTAYDYPNDHRGQYRYPVGAWEGVNQTILDRSRNKEFIPYTPRPAIQGNAFDLFWADPVWTNPDPTPRMVRISAEEVVRSIEMFGWDGIRWDGHPRGGGACGGENRPFDLMAARRTQALIHYFKDIVGAKHPQFGHGYNYYFIQDKPNYDWAYEDYELDELARGGGLMMNESIGNASGGKTFEFIGQNLQVEGDLSRERGGYLLGISFAKSPRDVLIESALWAAGGARPYNSAFSHAARRYCTRFSQYTFDENLRRLATPEKVLAPQTKTALWWQPFVYETPLANGKRQLVMNLLNLPLQAKRPPRNGPSKPEWDMPAGTDPVTFALTLPEGVRATAASLIDPETLEVSPLPLKDNHLEIPPVAIWRVAVIDLEADAKAPALASLYGPPKTFGVPRPDIKEEHKDELVLDPKREVWEVNKDMSALAPAWSVKLDNEQRAIDALSAEEYNPRLLSIREKCTPDTLINDWWKGGSLPADLKLKDTKFEFGDLSPQRNGRFDIYYGRGALDYRLRMPEVFAGLDRFAVHDSPLWGGLKQTPNAGLAWGVPWQRYPEFDLLLFTGIPHCAIGAENCYGLVEYVKAGGAAFFTGGEYAFGKGGYIHTVLERDLLPVLCIEMVDTRYSQTPLPIEPGKDFAELNAKVDFAAKPSFWVWNQVALKNDPGIKVFLKSGNRPILVGWQVGKGRVACLLIDHRGKSEKDATAFFDWADWPALSRAVFAWLAPDAGKSTPPRFTVSAAEARKIAESLESETLSSELNVDDDAATKSKASAPVAALTGAALDKRVAAIRQILAAPSAPADTGVLLEQLVSVGALPDDIRWAIIDRVRTQPSAKLAERVKSSLKSTDNAVRQSGCQLLGAVDAAVLLHEMNSPPQTFETDAAGRQRALALSVPLVANASLLDEGRRRVKQWNEKEQQVIDKWTGGKGFSLAAPEAPGLDADTLFQRVAWLAYLSRHDAQTFGAQFAREWLMTSEYQDYSERTIQNLWKTNAAAGDSHGKNTKTRVEEWGRLRDGFGRLRELTRPDMEALLKAQPDLLAEGFKHAHFTLEFRAAMNFLGAQDRAATAGILEKLKSADNADLAAFATARLSGAGAGK